MNFIPYFYKIFMNYLAISKSVPGQILSKYSITVTSEPNLAYTDPIYI